MHIRIQYTYTYVTYAAQSDPAVVFMQQLEATIAPLVMHPLPTLLHTNAYICIYLHIYLHIFVFVYICVCLYICVYPCHAQLNQRKKCISRIHTCVEDGWNRSGGEM